MTLHAFYDVDVDVDDDVDVLNILVDNNEEICSAPSCPSFESCTTIDGLPTIVSTNNRDEFINLYC